MEENKKGRSSLRLKTLNLDYNSNNISKKIQWNIKEETKSVIRKNFLNESKTPYISYDGEEDVYLKKISEINKMLETTDKLEEYSKKLENEYNSQDPIDVVITDEDDGIDTELSNENKIDLKKQYNSHHIKGSESFLEVESVSETLKNTFYNKFLGKLH